MRKYRVEILRRAANDPFDLYDMIAAEAGTAVAGATIDRIEAACLSLETSPLRGTKRDDLGTGLRAVGFERRATIVFRIRGSAVSIVRIFYGGQNYERVLRSGYD